MAHRLGRQFFGFLCASLFFVKIAAAAPPNIVLIVADDLGYGDLACYGSTSNQTPNIDNLARRGIRFTDFHSAGSMCTPTRVAMLTGQYQQRFGRVFDGPLSGTMHRDLGLPHSVTTIAEHLAAVGYATACFGKWHLGYKPPWLPPSHGFDVFRGLGSGDGDHHSHIDRSGNEDWWNNNELQMESGYTADLLTTHSIRFMEEHRDGPFFLYVPHLAIHFPWQGPNDPAHREKGTDYTNDKWGIIPNPKHVSTHVKAMVESIDKSVGEIVNALNRLGLDKNTIVFFTSDNGGYLTYGERFRNISSNGVLRGQKGTLYEGGHRVPMIVWWPETIQPRITGEVGHSTDLFPTFASLAGGAVDRERVDGVNLGPLIMNNAALPKRTLYWRAGEEMAVRSGAWKLRIENERRELFDLDSDIGEKTNLIDQRPEVAARLERDWNGWESNVNQGPLE